MWIGIHGRLAIKMDNDDPLYFGNGKIITKGCPWHGDNSDPYL